MKGKAKLAGCLFSVVVVAAALVAVGYWQRLELFRFLPNTPESACSMSDEGVMVVTETQKPFTGRLLSGSDERVEIYSYREGMLHGQNVVYHNGKIKEVGYWKDDMQNGRFQLYTEEGVLVDDGYFKDGVRHGTTKQYYDTNGKLRVTANYVEGELNGKVLYYYEDGNKLLEANYADGVLDGDAIYWTEDGLEVEGTLDESGTFFPY